ncbi:MAG: InlB B-repeat-containing protein [Clostridia bacterium]|nr:InlB B-repeat-containing protein [Clostridia bacterium]
MKKKIALIALAFVCVACLFTLTACGEENPLDFVTGQGNSIAVYYDEMMGSDPVWWQIKPGSPLPEPGVTPNVKKPERQGYVLLGYYQGTKDQTTGEVTYGEKWDFSTKVNESITLYAKWEKQYVIHINYMLDGQLVADKDDSLNIANNASQVIALKEPTFAGNTFVEMYSDAAMTSVLEVSSTNPFVHGCTQENPVVEVYARFVAGNWALVRTANDMRTISSGSRFYLLNDIDFADLNDETTGLTNITINRGTFVGAIEGNGHTIKNLHYFAKGETGTRPGATNFGLFSRVQNVSVTNLTFEDCSVVGQIAKESNEYFYAFFAGSATGENNFANITLKNCQVKPIQFDTIRISESKVDQLKACIEQKTFIATGSDFVPNVI